MAQFFFTYLNLFVIISFTILSPFIFIKILLPKIRQLLTKNNKKIFSNLINVKFFYSVSFIFRSNDYLQLVSVMKRNNLFTSSRIN